MKRGFKSWCERASTSYRKTLGLNAIDPLPAVRLAEQLEVTLTTPREIKGLSQKSISLLLNGEAKTWSAVTLSLGNKHIIIYNPSHAPTRQSNDIMHELSHVIIGHQPQQMHSYELGVLLRHYNQEQEEEADWLAAALLLPRDALVKIKFSEMSLDTAARLYGVSKTLISMRLNTSGINYIYRRKAEIV